MLRMWYKAQFTERSDQGLRQESSEQPPFGVGEAKIKSMDLAAGTAIENCKWQADDRQGSYEWQWLHCTNGDDETKTAWLSLCYPSWWFSPSCTVFQWTHFCILNACAPCISDKMFWPTEWEYPWTFSERSLGCVCTAQPFAICKQTRGLSRAWGWPRSEAEHGFAESQ